MSKFTLLILCAGFGKRMLDLTKNLPKPLLNVNDKPLLSHTINFFKEIGCNEFLINTHYLNNKIENYINNYFNNYPIKLIHEPSILGTGGGIKNIFNYTQSKKICVVNSDIYWQSENKLDLINFLDGLDNVTHCKILLSNEKNFFGLKKNHGDFNVLDNIVTNWIEGNELFYYTGLQIVSKNIFTNSKKVFPMNEIWNKLISRKLLKAELINSKIFHIGDKNTFEGF